ncbi:S26 family signal peptidase [Microbispora sp. NBRC 16548]|uniref:S26 family signal peptidase n=1 Tax=Microbispora sp. NBRC 16548 TaxID=3030994 RepID=UPI00160FFFA5|nr:S26 family signal peptidase [Microbispora sp. NBRC 16548]GLX04278.1 S26 family signal peptidase [Microbispora sp. NBRC 16548]
MTPVLLVLLASALGGVVVMVARRTLHVVEVHGESMEPGLWPGDQVLVRRLRPGRPGRRVRRGDIVVISRVGPGEGVTLDGGTNLAIKRAAAVAGDPIPPGFEALGETLVPPGRLLVLGDNPSRSTDSRQWGLLPESRITGVVLRRLNA